MGSGQEQQDSEVRLCVSIAPVAADICEKRSVRFAVANHCEQTISIKNSQLAAVSLVRLRDGRNMAFRYLPEAPVRPGYEVLTIPPGKAIEFNKTSITSVIDGREEVVPGKYQVIFEVIVGRQTVLVSSDEFEVPECR